MAYKQAGFTLIELLVTISILGILALIAIPQFSVYQMSALDKTAQSDLRNAVQAQEAAYLDRGQYWDCMNNGCNDPALPGLSLSDGMTMVCAPANGGEKYQCASRHTDSGSIFFYDSEFRVYWEIIL